MSQPGKTGMNVHPAIDKRVVLIVATVATFFPPFMSSAINVAIPSIGHEFGADAVSLSWITTVFILAAAVFLVPFGRLADIYGMKRIFLIGSAVIAISTLLCGFATSMPQLIVFRCIQGFGASMVFGTSMAILTIVYPARERGRAMGIIVAAAYLGLSVGPFIGGMLTQYLGWRSIFLITVPLAILVVGLIVWKIKAEWARARGERMDYLGSAVYGIGLIAFMYGLSIVPALNGVILIAVGVLAIVAFIMLEGRIPQPVLKVSLFKNNLGFSLSSVATLINYSATFAVTFLVSLYLQYSKGLDPQSTGIIMIAQPIIMTLVAPVAGRLSDRIEARLIASTGMAFTFVGLLLYSFLNDATSLIYIIVVQIVCGLGFALFSSPNNNAVMSSVEKEHYGIASATLGTMRLCGQMLSMGIATVMIAVYVGSVQITPAHHGALIEAVRAAFIIFAVLCFIGIFASLAKKGQQSSTVEQKAEQQSNALGNAQQSLILNTDLIDDIERKESRD